MDYYSLPKDKRWMGDNDSPYVIGGRSTDVDQIAYSLATTIKGMYPVNGVPVHIANAFSELVTTLQGATKAIDDFLALVSDEASKEGA